jgi:hypothetical protein
VDSSLQELTRNNIVQIDGLPLASVALQRRYEIFLARHQIELRTVKRIPAGIFVGPVTNPVIKAQVDRYRDRGRHCHLLDITTLDQYGSCGLFTDTQLCENRHLEDYPPLYIGFAHYSKAPAMAQHLRNQVLGPAITQRFGKEDLETQFRLFTRSLQLSETTPQELRSAGYYDRAYGYMAELYAKYAEEVISYFNLGPEHLVEAGHYLYQLGPDVFAQFSFRKTSRIGARIIAAAFFRSSGCKAALRDLNRWQRNYDTC